MNIRVLIADDQPIVRTGLTMLLDAQPGIEVVGAAADGREAVRLALQLRPDVGLFNIKGLRHYTASQLLAARFDLRNTAARLGHGSGGATTLRHYADPVSEVDRRAAAYLAQLTAGSVAPSK